MALAHVGYSLESEERFLVSLENGTIVTLDAWSGVEVGRFWSGSVLKKQFWSKQDVAIVGGDNFQPEHLLQLADRELPETRCYPSDEGERCGLLYGERKKKIIAVDVGSGQVVWVRPDDGLVRTNSTMKPALLQVDEYVARLMDANDGAETWQASYSEIKAFGTSSADTEMNLIEAAPRFPSLVWFAEGLQLSAVSANEDSSYTLWSIQFNSIPVNVFAATKSGSWTHVRVSEQEGVQGLYVIAPPVEKLMLAAPPEEDVVQDHDAASDPQTTTAKTTFSILLLLFLFPASFVFLLRRQRQEKTPDPPTPAVEPVVMMVSKERYASEFVEIEKLGDGGFGTVHRSLNRLDSTEYAVKKIIGGSLETVLREVKILASLDHPNIVRYYQAWLEERSEDDDLMSEEEASLYSSGGPLPEISDLVLYIQMQLCSARTLRDRLEDRPTGSFLDVSTTLKIFAQAARGLRYVHARGLIHRDLKPANFFFDGDTVKLGDFGLSRQTWMSFTGMIGGGLSSSGEDDDLTSGLGTRLYAAPEQLKKRTKNCAEDYDQKVDVFSLGVVLYEMLTPKCDTQMERYETLSQRNLNKMCTAPDDDLTQLVKAMVSHSPTKRPDANTVCAIAERGLDRNLVRQLGKQQNGIGHNVVLRDHDGQIRAYDAQGNVLDIPQ